MTTWPRWLRLKPGSIALPTTIGLVAGTVIAALFIQIVIPCVVPNQHGQYLSFATVDSYGAKNTSAMWTYDIEAKKPYFNSQSTAWAYFDADIRNIETSFNLSDYQGIGFYVMGMQEGQKVQFNLFTHNFTDQKQHVVYQYIYSEDILTTTNWRYVELPFSNFKLAPWLKDLSPDTQTPDIKKVFGFGFSVTTDNRLSNTIRVDEMCLLTKNGDKILITDFSALNATINGQEALFHAGAGQSRVY